MNAHLGSNISWEAVADDFARDGALRDIFIAQTGPSDWQLALDVVRELATDIRFRHNERLTPLPLSASAVFGLSPDLRRLLHFHLGDILFACHFFGETEIEFDFWPHEVQGQSDLDCVLGFVRRLGDSVGQPVIICPENSPQYAFLRYDPQSHSMKFLPDVAAPNA